MLDNYECETFTVLNAFYEQDHFTLYLRNCTTDQVIYQAFTFEQLSTQYLFFILGLMGESWENQQALIQNSKIDLIVKNNNQIVAFVDGNDFMFVDNKNNQDIYLRAQIEQIIKNRRAR